MGSRELIRLAKKIGLSSENPYAISEAGCTLDIHDLEVDPYDFLLRAEMDFEQGGDASDLNSITNAKRAIVSQMDQALLTFGYPATRWNIPKKIKQLQNLGLASPRILEKVSSARNLLEHEYRRPKKAEIEEALDLALLFVHSVKPILLGFMDEFVVGNASELIDSMTFSRHLSFSMGWSVKPVSYRIVAWVDCGPFGSLQGKIVGRTSLSCNDELFPVVIRLALAAHRRFKLEKALADFCQMVLGPTTPRTGSKGIVK